MVSLFSHRIHSLLLLSFVTFHAYTAADNATLAQDQAALQQTCDTAKAVALNENAMDELLSSALHQTERIDTLLEELALISNNNAKLTKEQRSALAKEIRTIRKTLGDFKKLSFTSTSPQELSILLLINKELSAHLEKALATGFTSLEPFSLETHITRGLNEQNVTLEKLAKAAQENDTNLKSLEKTAQSVGLTWYNKVYRALDSAIFQPCEKYRIVQRSAVVLGTAAVALGSWWYFTKRGIEVTLDDGTKAKSGTALEQWLRAFLGEAPQWGKITVQVPTNLPKEQPAATPAPIAEKKGLFDQVSTAIFGKKNTPPSGNVISEQSAGTRFKGIEIETITNEEKLKTAGHLVATFQEHKSAIFGTAGLAASVLWPYAKKDYEETKAWFYKKWVDSINHLKGGAFTSRTVSLSPEGMAKEPVCSFDDIVGADNAKEVLSSVIQYLIDPEKFDQAKITPEKGYLFTGPTRTGKSFMAEAFAGELRKQLRELGKDPESVKFYPVDATMIFDVGGIKPILAYAKKMAPCILFIDEIDLLQLQRAGGNSTLLSDFLVGLSNFSLQDPDKQVVILAATNRSENLDEALKRRGRLGVEIRFSYPSYSYRKQFFAHKLQDIGVTTEDLNLDSLAEQTYGRSYDDLNGILKKALQQAKAEHCALDQELLERAIDSEIFLILPQKDHPLSETERRIIAISVAGQVLVNHLLDTATLSLKATINPYMPKLKEKTPWLALTDETTKQDLIKYGKIFSANKNEFLNDAFSSEQLSNICKMLLAGRCAQKLLLGISSHDADTVANVQSSYKLAKNIVSKGIDGSMLSDKMRDALADKAFALIETFEQETTTLLEQHKEQLDRLVSELLKFGTLNRDEISLVLDGKHPQQIVLSNDADELTSAVEQPAATV